MAATAPSTGPALVEIGAGTSTAARRSLGVLVLLLVWFATWALSHGYNGIEHDGRLYTLQALAHLRPQSLSHDVFLRFGSQDRYTIFSPMYAAVIGWLGTDYAAASLTLLLQLALVGGAVLLARKTTSPRLALMGVSVLIAVPGTYGAYRVFSCLETFVTPRMAAEALVLGGLALALSARGKGALVLMALATLLHPVMAVAGWVALVILHVAIPRPRVAAVAGLVTLTVLAAIAIALPFGPFSRFDAPWLELVRLRSPYLFVTGWQLADWGRAFIILATLVIGVWTLPAGRARTLCHVGLLTGLCGVALTLVACDGLQLVRFTQLQSWRWMWLATTAAAVMLPTISWAGWQGGAAGKSTILMLVAAWILGDDPMAADVAAAAVVSMIFTWRLGSSVQRLIFYGTCGLLIIAIAARMGWNSLFLNAFYYDPALPEWLRDAASFVQDGTIPLALALLTLWLVSSSRGMPGLVVLATLTTGACVCLLPVTWSRWTHQQFPASMVARFDQWRALIPSSSEVLWPESALETAVLLGRSDYLSTLQTTGVVFSREAAREMQRRANALGAIVPPTQFFAFSGTGLSLGPTPAQLERACGTGEFPFVVTGVRLSWPALSEVSQDVWHNSRGLRLYRCSDRHHG